MGTSSLQPCLKKNVGMLCKTSLKIQSNHLPLLRGPVSGFTMLHETQNSAFPLLHVLVFLLPILSLTHTYLSVFVYAEILDFGYPQNSETGALKTFITQQGIKGQVSKTD